MKCLTIISCLLIAFGSTAQTVFWNETFDNGCTSLCDADGYVSVVGNGTWTEFATGVNETAANAWFISCAENGEGAGNCGVGCGSNATLHVGNIATSPSAILVCPTGDCGAAYDSGTGLCPGFFDCVTTNKRIESPLIDCSGRSNITLSFVYMEGGEGSIDDATLDYHDGTSWSQLDPIPKTNNSGCLGQGRWTAYSVALPASANNNPNIRIGFNWTNDDNAGGGDPSFAVDDVELSISCTPPTLAKDSINVDCFGESTGEAWVIPSGATPPYTFSWDNASTDSLITGLAAGSYTVTVTDDVGCSISVDFDIEEPAAAISFTTSAVDANCSASDGSATVNPSGGSSPYNFSWNSGQTTQTAANIPAGSYFVEITDDNNCLDTAFITVASINPMTLAGSSTDASCGSTDGSATVSPSGGATPYLFSWDNSQTTQTATALATGTYKVVVTDDNGCMDSINITVNQASGPALNIVGTDVDCNGAANGEADLVVTGGAAPFNFSWDHGSTDEDLTNISGGTYIVTVTDDDNCVVKDTIVIQEPNAISLQFSKTDATCGNNDGSIDLTVSGGSLPYNYSWSNNSTDEDLNSIAAGTYTVIVRDDNNCPDSITIAINNPGAPVISTISTQDVSCMGGNDGEIIISVDCSANPPCNYTWSPNVSSGDTASGLNAGTYTVTLEDASNCQSSEVFEINDADSMILTLTGTDPVNCTNPDGLVNLEVSGGTFPYTYSWDHGATTANLNKLEAGTYTVTVTDENGCTTTASVNLAPPDSIAIDAVGDTLIELGGSTPITTIGDTAGGFFSWKPTSGLSCSTCPNPVASPEITTSYILTYTRNSCFVYDTVRIEVIDFFIPTAFSPNGDGTNDLFIIYGTSIARVSLNIYDRWGEKIFEYSGEASSGWDGTYKSREMGPGVYPYYAEIEFENGRIERQPGSITLIR